jgi:hypothetical protein
MANKRIKLPKLVKRKPPVIDKDKLAALFDCAKETRLFPFVVVAASSGVAAGNSRLAVA